MCVCVYTYIYLYMYIYIYIYIHIHRERETIVNIFIFIVLLNKINTYILKGYKYKNANTCLLILDNLKFLSHYLSKCSK